MPAAANSHGSNRTGETFESLWRYCTSEGRAVPRDWQRFYSLLKGTRQLPGGGWEPPLPLILGAWHETTPIEKQLRFEAHVEWARDHAQLDQIGSYLRSLPASGWFHFGEI